MLALHALFLVALAAGTDASKDAAARSERDVVANEGANDVAKSDQLAREARRILHLANGQTVRVVAREVDGRWEYRGKGGWQPLAQGLVRAARLESDVLREWRTKRDAADLRDTDARVALASWAAREGLAVETLEQLDVVLTREPDHAGALALLREHKLISVPSSTVPPEKSAEARDAIVRFASPLPPAAREQAVLELGRTADREALRAHMAKELRSNIVQRRSFAALTLRRLFAGTELKPLLVASVLDASQDVRAQSALALKAANEPGLCAPLARTLLENPNSIVRARAAEALGVIGHAAAVAPLIAGLRASAAQAGGGGSRTPHQHIFTGRQLAYVQDFDVEVAQFAAVADPVVNVLLEGEVLDVGVRAVTEESVVVEMQTIRRALEKITRERPGAGNAHWLAWWDKHRARYEEPATRTGAGQQPDAR